MKSLIRSLLVGILAAATLYLLVSITTWVLSQRPWFTEAVADTAKNFGVQSHQLVEFQALVAGGIFLALQLWVTHRRINAAEQTAQAAAATAEANARVAQSTVSSNTSQRFKEAIELLGHQSEIVRAGGIQALIFIARDNPDYQLAISTIIDNYNRYHAITDESVDGAE